MAKQVINIGQTANDGTGDPLRVAMDKTNDNFTELYRSLGGTLASTAVNIINDDGVINVTGKFNKISYLLNDESELYALNPATYHGCLAHVHSTGALYYAHGQWRKLLTDNANNDVTSYADSLSDIAYSGFLIDANSAGFGLLQLDGISDGANGQVLTTNGNGTFTFSTVTGGGGGGVVAAANTFSTIAVSGQTNVVADSSSDTLTLIAGDNITITTSGDTITFNAANSAVANSGGGSSSFSATRLSETVSTPTIADGATSNIEFGDLGKSYVLHKIQVDYASRVRIYADAASRTADASRPQGTDPVEGDGVIAEYIASQANTFLITPGIYGFIDSGNTIPVAVTNLSGSAYPIGVTLTALKLEE